MCKKQLKLYHVFLSTQNREDQEKYKQYRNTLKQVKGELEEIFITNNVLNLKETQKNGGK